MTHLVRIFCLAMLILPIPGLVAQEAESPALEEEQSDLIGDDLGDLLDDDLGNLLGELELEEEKERSLLPDGLSLKAEHLLLGGGALSEVSSLSEPSLQPRMENRIQFYFDQNKGLALAAGLLWYNLLKEDPQSGQITWQSELDSGETYVSLYNLQGLWSLYLGFQYFSWGTADRISPIDILNPRNLRLSPRPRLNRSRQEKLSVLGVKFQLEPISWFRLEAAYLPFYRDNQLDTRAALKGPLALMGIKKPPKVLGSALDFRKPTLGGRMRFDLRSQNVSVTLGLNYLYAPDSALTPKIKVKRAKDPKTGNSLPFFVADELQLEREQLHHWGFDVRLGFPSWNLWLDSVFSLNPNWSKGSYATRSPKFESVLGMDVQYGPQQRFYANFQYSLRWLPDYRESLDSLDYQSTDLQPFGINQTLPFQVNRKQDYYRNYYLYQLSDPLAGYNEGLLQRFLLSLDFPFEPPTRNIAWGWILGLKLGYELPLLAGENAMHQLYANPELRFLWNWQTNPKHSIQFNLAFGAELFGAFDEQNSLDQSKRYPSQLYLELSLLW